jgi:uncharacterized membrane protein YfcA
MVSTLAVALVYLNRNKDRKCHKQIPVYGKKEIMMFLGAGFVGGIMSGLVGSGIDIITFMVMVLLFRLDEKVATPTTVILMTVNTIYGFALHSLVLGNFTGPVVSYWMAAVPVVCIGAPLGAYLCSLMKRGQITYFLVGLITLEAVSTAILVPMSQPIMYTAIASFIIFGCINFFMCRVRLYCPTGKLIEI